MSNSDSSVALLAVVGIAALGGIIWYLNRGGAAAGFSAPTGGAQLSSNLNPLSNKSGATNVAAVEDGVQVGGLLVGSTVIEEASAGDPGSGIDE